jgi:hypothetical protein
MCLITKTTYTACKHTKVYTDRSAYHAFYFHSKQPLKCKKTRVNEVRIEGVCEGCLEPNLDARMGEEPKKDGGNKDIGLDEKIEGRA